VVGPSLVSLSHIRGGVALTQLRRVKALWVFGGFDTYNIKTKGAPLSGDWLEIKGSSGRAEVGRILQNKLFNK
jgi:hypothetical protein